MTYSHDIRLLVLDIDGTLAGVSNQIRPAVMQTIRVAQAKGVEVAIATGRMYQSALRFHHDVGSKLPLLAYQGALIKEPATAIVHRHCPLPKAIALQLLNHFEQMELNSLLSIHFYINDQLYVREITSETQAYAERSGVDPIVVIDLRQALVANPTKVLALSDNIDLIDTLLSSLQQHYTPAELYFTKSVATFFEAAHPEVNKGAAVRYLAEEMLSLQREQVMAIGDNFNDVEMLNYAGLGIAMGNAPEEVKAKADWVAPDVDHEGVAAAIEEFIL